MDQLISWQSSARAALNQAQDIGVEADEILRRFKLILDGNNLLILKIKYMTEFLENQIETMSRIFSALQKFNRKFQEKFRKRLAKFSELIGQLNARLTSLNNITVEPRLRKSSSESRFSLYDYLELGEFLKLQQNYELITENFGGMNKYLEDHQLKFFQGSLINFNNFCRNLVFEFNGINNHFYKELMELNVYSNDNSNTQLSTNEKFSILINFYELEMANLVQSLAHHFDQCTEAISLYENGKKQQLGQLVGVLKEDSLEAPNVLTDLHTLFGKIKRLQESKSLEHLNGGLTRIYSELIVNNFIVNDFLTKTNTNLNIAGTMESLNKLDFNFIRSLFIDDTNVDLSVENNIYKLQQYLDFLKSFEKSYYELVSHLESKVRTQERIKEMIREFQKEIAVLEEENRNNTKKIQKDLGLFLPSDLGAILDTNDTKVEVKFEGIN